MKDEAEPQCLTPSTTRTRRQTAQLLIAAVAGLSASLGMTDAHAASTASGDANQDGVNKPHQ